ncbi:MAG: hypothetical protein HC837_17145 [Chloroflexaceae bacterium]|nr:hypothetical protein [Chloroflexaceae bacterium]
MNADSRQNQHAAIQQEAQQLLNTLTIPTDRPTYSATAMVSVMVSPCPAETTGLVDLPITVFPIARHSRCLQDVPIILRQDSSSESGTPITYYGRLNQRGQIIFRNVAPGSYQAKLMLADTPRPQTTSTPTSIWWDVTPLPQYMLRADPAAASVQRQREDELAPTTSRRTRERFQNQSGSLDLEMQEQESGEYVLIFQTARENWENAVLLFEWRTMSLNHVGPEEPQQYLTILTWNKQRRLCRSEINLGRVFDRYELALPEQPLPIPALNDIALETLERSINACATDRARRAWRRLVSSGVLTPAIAHHIEHMLER